MKQLFIIAHTFQDVDMSIETFHTPEKTVRKLGELVDDGFRKPAPTDDPEEYLSEYLSWVREEQDNTCDNVIVLEVIQEEAKSGFFKAWIETRHFEFEAYGSTKEDAIAILEKTWAIHMDQYDATMTWEELKGDVGVAELKLGGGYRDRDEVVLQEETAEFSLTMEEFKEFKELYRKANDRNWDNFQFRDRTFVTGYAKYLIEYLEGQNK